ncbi:MAG TPA: zinc-dependent alcohol dehydrogenase family protein [Kofleriaceae bacterium]|nr:zinc-dependent alcohol dehydrogenase family protein [Kofleriaceae bacterium]
MKRVTFSRFGKPSEVAEVVDVPMPQRGPDEALVRMRAAPINPADYLLLTGNHASRPRLPAFAGIEGLGDVVEASTLAPGTRVILPPGSGTWAEFVVVPEASLISVPNELDVEQAAMLAVNPATAWLLLELTGLGTGDWLVQNAATSAVARLIIRLARTRGVRTINVVRRADAVAALTAIGADAVLVGEDDLAARVRAAAHGAPLRWALDAIAGAASGQLAACLTPGGTLVTYGLLSYSPVQIPAALMVFGDITCRGFSRYSEVARMGSAAARAMYARVAALVADGTLRSEIEARYPLDRVRDALEHTDRSGRAGKVVLTMSDSTQATAP